MHKCSRECDALDLPALFNGVNELAQASVHKSLRFVRLGVPYFPEPFIAVTRDLTIVLRQS